MALKRYQERVLREDRREEARSILVPTYAWFTEGFDAGKLREAKSLLDALSPG